MDRAREDDPGGVVPFGELAGFTSASYPVSMSPPSNSGYCFPAEVIRHAVWLYVRFTLSCRDVEEFLAEWGIVVTRA